MKRDNRRAQAEYAAAVARFRSFHERQPRAGEIRTIALSEPETVLAVGELDRVIYKVRGKRTGFAHQFKKTDRPLLFVSSDGRQIYVLKGAYRFTDRGFIG